MSAAARTAGHVISFGITLSLMSVVLVLLLSSAASTGLSLWLSARTTPLAVPLVRFNTLSMAVGAYPSGPSNVNQLKRVQCTTATYQRARPAVSAQLSSGAIEERLPDVRWNNRNGGKRANLRQDPGFAGRSRT